MAVNINSQDFNVGDRFVHVAGGVWVIKSFSTESVYLIEESTLQQLECRLDQPNMLPVTKCATKDQLEMLFSIIRDEY